MLTEQQTSLIINDGMSVAGKKLVELQEAKNHAHAIDLIHSRGTKKQINNLGEKEVCQIHETILHDIQEQYAGVYRNQTVRIAGSITILPNYAKVPTLMQEREKKFQKSGDNTLLLAIQAHYDLVTIYPFIDGNGRTARLLMNAIFLLIFVRWISTGFCGCVQEKRIFDTLGTSTNKRYLRAVLSFYAYLYLG